MAGISHCLNIHAPLKHKLIIERPKIHGIMQNSLKANKLYGRLKEYIRKTKTILNKSIFTKQTFNILI